MRYPGRISLETGEEKQREKEINLSFGIWEMSKAIIIKNIIIL
jgi:hypothetical protein